MSKQQPRRRSATMNSDPSTDDQSDAAVTVETEALDNTLIEDVSIDGMCGVY
jgi:mycofactocin precursor